MTLFAELKESGRGVRRIVEALEDASTGGEGDLVRWEALRRVGGAFASKNILIPLDNDGNLVQQLEGMTRWCQHFAKRFGLTEGEASFLALGFSARQLEGRNILLNAQSSTTRSDEALKIKQLADTVLTPAGDCRARDVFLALGRQLGGLERTSSLGECLDAARAAFYVETGVSAVKWILRGVDLWAHDKAREVGAPESFLEAAGQTACRLAANAYHNNARTVWRTSQKTLKDLIELPIDPSFWAVLQNKYYPDSLRIAKEAPPSYDRTSKRPEWPLVLGLPKGALPFSAHI